MRVWFKIKLARIKLIMAKIAKEAKKLALVIVLTEFLAVGVVYYVCQNDYILSFFQPKTVFIQVAQAKQPEQPKVKDKAEELADRIYRLESTGGQNDQKCERIGGHNGYGFGQGKGRNFCLASDNEMRKLVIEWIKDKQSQGLTDSELLCLYNTGTISQACDYIR